MERRNEMEKKKKKKKEEFSVSWAVKDFEMVNMFRCTESGSESGSGSESVYGS